MTLSPLGIFSAAGAGGAPQTFELIETNILGSNQSLITFSNLGNFSSTYRHLQVRATFRTTHSSFEGMRMRINGDSGTNYARHGLFGNGSSVSSFAVTGDTKIELVEPPISSSTANAFAGSVVDILDAYSTTKNKTVRSLNASDVVPRILLHSGVWLNTASITSLQFSLPTGNILAGSRFSLYGIRG